jgi:hypothetical protein
MAAAKRVTVYLDVDLHRALRVKARETERNISDLVNESVRSTLAEDAEDLKAFRQRSKAPAISFAKVLSDLKRRGRL